MTHRLARTASAAILLLPAVCHAVDSGSTAYRSGKAAGYVLGGLLLFFLARRLLGGLAWARWLIVPAIAIRPGSARRTCNGVARCICATRRS